MAVKVKDIMNLRTVRRSHKQDLEQLHGQLRSVTPIPNSQNKGSLKHRCETQTIHNGGKKKKKNAVVSRKTEQFFLMMRPKRDVSPRGLHEERTVLWRETFWAISPR